MKKIIGIILSLAMVGMLSSFVTSHNVSNKKCNYETVSGDNVEWKFVNEEKAIRDDGGTFTVYVWVKYRNGSKTETYACTRLHGTVPTKGNVFANPYKGKSGDFRAEYDIVGYPDGRDHMGYYWNIRW